MSIFENICHGEWLSKNVKKTHCNEKNDRFECIVIKSMSK